MKDLYLVYKNLTRKKMRLFLTSLAIFVAFLIFGAVTALQGALNSGIEMSADNRLVVVHKTNFTNPLPYAYVNKVQNIDGVHQVTHANWFGGYYQEPANQVITMAVDPDTYFDVYSELVVSPEQMAAWKANRAGVMVGERLAKVNNWKVGDQIPISSNIFSKKEGGHTWELKVEGIFGATDPQVDTGYMVFHYKYFMETQSWGGDNVGWLVLTTDDPAINEQVAKAIDETFANSQAETDTSTEKAFNKAFIEQIGNIGLIIFGVVFMAFFTILVVVGNTMVLAIRERTAEIAVLKTLGFSSPRIFRMILAESCLLSFLGGLLGLGAAYLAVDGASEFLARFLPNLVLDGSIALQALGYMLLLGLVTGIVPAISALRLNIISGFSKG
ncbi:FtsX-like permease family protein [Aliiglaciecola sp. CAU 1673]|uniref:ABC transporter permease n=1 Tax=Aliiglaciecola sp. CAU 1673 TaxID=3032595 RepID=UPI0023DB715C|nr:FtsX-like permease family protein [Aliiglaciecola sp. CAU 1673]MDF2179448.1 FtsX-like permease family protein [Aliiglaciecola sp. CAU 1673]